MAWFPVLHHLPLTLGWCLPASACALPGGGEEAWLLDSDPRRTSCQHRPLLGDPGLALTLSRHPCGCDRAHLVSTVHAGWLCTGPGSRFTLPDLRAAGPPSGFATRCLSVPASRSVPCVPLPRSVPLPVCLCHTAALQSDPPGQGLKWLLAVALLPLVGPAPFPLLSEGMGLMSQAAPLTGLEREDVLSASQLSRTLTPASPQETSSQDSLYSSEGQSRVRSPRRLPTVCLRSCPRGVFIPTLVSQHCDSSVPHHPSASPTTRGRCITISILQRRKETWNSRSHCEGVRTGTPRGQPRGSQV